MRRTKGVDVSDFEKDFDDAAFVESLKAELRSIPTGSQNATRYHQLMVGILEYIFYPNLAYPKPEQEINAGRKRIDIVYTNAAKGGFWERIASHHDVPCQYIMAECKNYSTDVENPELDQLAGRFSNARGRVGILTSRNVVNRQRYVARCKDVTAQNNGYVIALVDQDIETLLDFAASHRRSQIDVFLEERFRSLMM